MLERRLREATTALIEFSRSVFKEFTMSHREKITEYLADAPNVKDAAHTLKVFAEHTSITDSSTKAARSWIA